MVFLSKAASLGLWTCAEQVFCEVGQKDGLDLFIGFGLRKARCGCVPAGLEGPMEPAGANGFNEHTTGFCQIAALLSTEFLHLRTPLRTPDSCNLNQRPVGWHVMPDIITAT